MRLFIALDIDDAIRQRITRFVDGVQGFAPEARWAKPESLHVTLKFIGEQNRVPGRPDQERADRGRRQCGGNSLSGTRFFPHSKIATRLLDRHSCWTSTGSVSGRNR